jgi:hypothetical protein
MYWMYSTKVLHMFYSLQPKLIMYLSEKQLMAPTSLMDTNFTPKEFT